MKTFYLQRRSYLLFAVACVTLFCSACGSTTNTQPGKSPLAKSTPTLTIQSFPAGPIVYVAMGASDAVGVGSSKPDSQGYVPLLAQQLPRGSRLVNLGISGIRLHAAISQELPEALSTHPQLVTIWLVANDFVGGVAYDNYMKDLDTLLNQLHTKTKARIVMANLPDLTLLPAFAKLTSAQKEKMLAQIQRWNTGLANIAARYNVIVVDLYSQQSELTAHPEYVSKDGFHPSSAGYMQLANDFWKAIHSLS